MFFLIDIVLFVLLGLAILFSIKKGFTGHFVFGIVKTVLSIAAGVGAAVGVVERRRLAGTGGEHQRVAVEAGEVDQRPV